MTIRSTNIAAAPRSPPRTRSGRRSIAATGRGAPGQPLTAAAPDSASAALSGASTREPTVCPWTTGASEENASSTEGGIDAEDSSSPDRMTTRRAPWTTASACRSDETAALWTAGTEARPRSSLGVPMMTVAAVVGSQFSAEAPEMRSACRSPRTTASTIIASMRVSHAPRFSAAAAYTEAAVNPSSRPNFRTAAIIRPRCRSLWVIRGITSSKYSRVERTSCTVCCRVSP